MSAEHLQPQLQEPIAKAERLVAEDKLEQAMEVLKDVVDRSPEVLRPRLLLGTTLMQLGKNEDAAVILADVIKKWPKNSEAHLLLAYVRLDHGDKELARQGLQKVLEMTTNTDQQLAAHLGIASLYENDGLLTEATIHYGKALDIEPGLRDLLMTVQKQLLWRQPIATPGDNSGHTVPNQLRLEGMKDELKKLREGHNTKGGLGND